MNITGVRVRYISGKPNIMFKNCGNKTNSQNSTICQNVSNSQKSNSGDTVSFGKLPKFISESIYRKSKNPLKEQFYELYKGFAKKYGIPVSEKDTVETLAEKTAMVRLKESAINLGMVVGDNESYESLSARYGVQLDKYLAKKELEAEDY